MGAASGRASRFRVHLVDGTYELFRHFYAGISIEDDTGKERGAVVGVVQSMIGMLEGGATQVIAGTRDPSKVAIPGVETRRVDFADPASLDAAFAGVDQLLIISTDEVGEVRQKLQANAVAAAGKAGIAVVVIRTRQYLAALMAQDDILVLNTLRYHDELKDPSELKVPEARVSTKELDMAMRLVEDMATDWKPGQYKDTYREDLMKLIEEKAEGKSRAAPRGKRTPREAEVIDFARLLEKSLAAVKKGDAPAGKRAAASSRKRRGAASSRGPHHRRAA